ncbi:hypothetical protein LDO51_16950 [Providencia alcalifaciens]|nr:hypothetical protein [Providencia alcalifaciens]UBX48810.1 hypothetical protein LDO51_16950 [Providencia alcalifaciens]
MKTNRSTQEKKRSNLIKMYLFTIYLQWKYFITTVPMNHPAIILMQREEV